MNAELIQSVCEYIRSNPGAEMLAQDEANRLRVTVAKHFGFSGDRLWWWDEVDPERATVVEYQSNKEWLHALLAILCRARRWLLFVTDNDFPPWPCVRGTASCLVDMLQEHRVFEYLIVDEELKMCVFDTHHNCLIGLGDLHCENAP